MKYELPSFDIIGKASDLIQGPPKGTADMDQNGLGLHLLPSKLEE
jgi:hypothetical protein